MEASFMDKALDETKRRVGLVRAKLREEYKHTKPFRMEPVSKEVMLYEYDQMTKEVEMGDTTRFNKMREEKGDLNFNEYLMEMDKLSRSVKHG